MPRTLAGDACLQQLPSCRLVNLLLVPFGSADYGIDGKLFGEQVGQALAGAGAHAPAAQALARQAGMFLDQRWLLLSATLLPHLAACHRALSQAHSAIILPVSRLPICPFVSLVVCRDMQC